MNRILTGHRRESFGKPLENICFALRDIANQNDVELVIREVTERTEGIEAGTTVMVGTDEDIILKSANKLLKDTEVYLKMAKAISPYGDGKTSGKIAQILLEK